MTSAGAGSSQAIPMTLVKNQIPGLTYDSATSRITFGTSGLYKLEYVYEASHSGSCTLSSYIVDFPSSDGVQRIHSTASHNPGSPSNHGGVISYTAQLPANKIHRIAIGRGQSGNCSGAGMNLAAVATQLFIFKVGN